MQVDKFLLIDLALRLLLIDLHFFIATIQIGVIVQVCYTPQAQCVTCMLQFQAEGERRRKPLNGI